MTATTLIFITMMYLLCKSEDTKLMLLISGCVFLSDMLMFFAGSDYYFTRHIVKDIFLAFICIWLSLTNPKSNFIWAAIICLISASTMVYEGLHQYQSPIYHYLNTIQFVLMQLYLIALTYKANWRLPCPEQLKSLSLSRNRSERIPTTAQNECQQSDMERW